MFKVALAVCKHYCETTADQSASEISIEQFERLCKRWDLIEAGPDVRKCLAALEQELARESDDLLRGMSARLSEKFNHDSRLEQINKIALAEAVRCALTWGGREAAKRIKTLKLMGLHCESTNKERTELYFDRKKRRITIRVGDRKNLLEDCMLLEFSLFHEYLSHAYPHWDVDQSTLSEQWLFAVELEWFETEWALFDSTLLWKAWNSRVGDAFRAAQWLLRRCRNQNRCTHKFLLEWLATWSSNPDDLNINLLSLIQGVMKKTATHLGNSAKSKRRLHALEEVLCKPCPTGVWDHEAMVARLTDELG